MHLVFAFGTLKRGFALHDRGLGGARFLGACRIVKRMPMLVAGPWFAPMMLDRPGEGFRVKGELYQVDDARLLVLDRLESVGEPGNFRIVLDVELVGAGELRRAFAFVKAPELAKPAHSGYLEDYQDRRFVPPERR
ncbi:gamma-glutamylcyclotransferase family protein [Aquamicrobium sp. LC103]|uniref:gamma-glutamylcyclotransferase family protein n=1 Tax=Aquamicrobium sp. LC103 TaxID=1120658 RepID=UPI00063E88F3|nr:gamma-glutamylcyclotransferase family protein [Aquamicrobium sp. LC103]TKT75440.1 gamma-glutamylcyclotransferase [Aquamicrobium sp. LC103]